MHILGLAPHLRLFPSKLVSISPAMFSVQCCAVQVERIMQSFMRTRKVASFISKLSLIKLVIMMHSGKLSRTFVPAVDAGYASSKATGMVFSLVGRLKLSMQSLLFAT